VSGGAAGAIGNSLVRGGMPWAELGNAAANVAEGQANYEIRAAEQRDTLAVSKALDQAQARATARLAELDPMSPDYLKDTDEILKQEQEGAREGAQLTYQGSADRLNNAFAADHEKARAGALISQGRALDEQSVTQFTQSTNAALNQILQDPGSFNAVIEETALRNLPLIARLPQAAREQMLSDFRDSSLLTLAQGMAEAGDYAQATALLADQAGEIDPAKVTAMRGTIRGIENRHRAERVRDSAQAFANLELQVYGLGEGPPSTRADIDAAKARGAYFGREQAYVSHARIIRSREEAQVAAENVNASLTAAIGSPYGKQGDVDDRWEALLESTYGEGATPEQRADLLMQFVRLQRAVPSFIQDRLAFGETATNPDELASAAALYNQMNSTVPGIDLGLNQTSDIIALSEQMRYSDQPATQLASTLISQRRQLPQDRDGLELAWKTDRQLLWNTENPIREDLADGLGIEPEEVTAGMLGMFENVTEDVFLSANGGDRNRARSAALARVKERYAPSQLVPGGRAPYAPERALPPNLQLELDAQGQADYINGALEAFGTEANILPGILPGFETEEVEGTGSLADARSGGGSTTRRVVDGSGLPPYALPADLRTQTELRQGGRATYPVRVRSDVGYVSVNVSEADRAEAERILRNHPRLLLDDMGYLRYRMPGADEAENDPSLRDLARATRERRRGIFERLGNWVSGNSEDDPTREAMEAIGPLVAP
jgi:hypothetical protein